jgi:hypothetical protein
MSDVYSFKYTPVRLLCNGVTGGIPATNITFSTTNNITQVKSLGKRQAFYSQVPNDVVTHNISFQYNIQNDDLVKSFIDNMKNNFTDVPPSGDIDIAGLRFSGCYLDSFSFTVEPDKIVNAQASFFTFFPPNGQIGMYTTQQSLNSNFLHGSRAAINATPNNYLGQTEDYTNLFNLSYSFKAEYLPVKVLNTQIPRTVKFNGASEEFEMSEALYRRVIYTGDSRVLTIAIEPLCCPGSSYSTLISGAQSTTLEGSSAVDGITTTRRRFTKYY